MYPVFTHNWKTEVNIINFTMFHLSTIVAAFCCVCCVAGIRFFKSGSTSEPSNYRGKSLLNISGYDLFVDLTTGTTRNTGSSLSWATSLYGSGTCGKRGVLKLSFGAPGSANRKNKVLIDMWFNNPSGWVFNIGDSSTNNGYGGDSGTTSRDAEIQGTSSTFSIYGNDMNSPAGGILLTRPNIIINRLSVIIADGLVIWNNWGAEFNYYLNTNLLYALNGQSDSEGGSPNYDIYFGINRSVGSGGRVGSGLCHAFVTWLS